MLAVALDRGGTLLTVVPGGCGLIRPTWTLLAGRVLDHQSEPGL